MNIDIITTEDLAELLPGMVDLSYTPDGTIEGTHPIAGAIRFTPICTFTGRGILVQQDHVNIHVTDLPAARELFIRLVGVEVGLPPSFLVHGGC